MIQIAGMPAPPHSLPEWPLTPQQRIMLATMARSPSVYSYASWKQLRFELDMRMQIIQAALDMHQSGVAFATFEQSRCNEMYWMLTPNGGFQLRPRVRPSAAIEDIYANPQLYAFECATAMVIIYYKAALESIDRDFFDRLFANLYVRDWQYDRDLGIRTFDPPDYFPGDIRYFRNPDVHPDRIEFQGENAVDLGNGLFFGHGIGILSAPQMIAALNRMRRPGAVRSAYMLAQATNPDYKYLSQFAGEQRTEEKIGAEPLLPDDAVVAGVGSRLFIQL